MKNFLLPLALGVAVAATSCKPTPPAPTPSTPTPPPATPAPTPTATPAPTPVASAPVERPPGAPRPSAEGRSFQQRAEERLQRMKAEIGLTDDQAQKVRAIYEQTFAPLRDLMTNPDATREERRAAFDKARAEANAQIVPLLTPEQKTKWDQYQAEMEQRRAQWQQRQSGGGSQ